MPPALSKTRPAHRAVSPIGLSRQTYPCRASPALPVRTIPFGSPYNVAILRTEEQFQEIVSLSARPVVASRIVYVSRSPPALRNQRDVSRKRRPKRVHLAHAWGKTRQRPF